MTVELLDPEDPSKLSDRIPAENDAKQRDRYRAVLLAIEGQSGDEIAEQIGRSPRFVDKWVARYRSKGLDGLKALKTPGKKPKLTVEQQQKLKERLDAGVTEADGVCTLRGREICRIVEQEFGVVHSLGGIYRVLHRLGYSSLKPRPRHRKNDPQAMEQFVQSAPLFFRR